MKRLTDKPMQDLAHPVNALINIFLHIIPAEFEKKTEDGISAESGDILNLFLRDAPSLCLLAYIAVKNVVRR